MSDFLPDARAVVKAVYGKQCQAAAEWRVKPSAVSNWISRNRLPPHTEHRIKLKLLAEGMSAPDHLWQRPSRDLAHGNHAEAV